ncbi:hypothetical protein [Allomuricauda sp. SCSIO 65647]|uniref:hypothetical protein n=1 Tax=Allomuricauda sp. SCSIO 65647 TaxID=2908843 RepID=UPI001F26EE4F|nr:hypothetical protein [Muricauda sp. SCSIO 65647]UJH66662.1 hypothetical protein L0P89_11895 [Muricauda sp. SCSIO 65647]
MKTKEFQTLNELATLGERRIQHIKKQFELTESELSFLLKMNQRYRKKLPLSIMDILNTP